jgi:hypothetical protein
MSIQKQLISGQLLAVEAATGSLVIKTPDGAGNASAIARDASLIPTNSADLEPMVVLPVGATLNLESAASYVSDSVPAGSPLIVMVMADLDFYWGLTMPNASKADAYEKDVRSCSFRQPVER